MTTSLDHPAVTDYLSRLEAAAMVLPAGRRLELLADIREHLAAAMAGAAGGNDDTTVFAVLDRLGSPEHIVAAEGEVQPVGSAPRSSPWGAVEIVAVLGLTVGAIMLPFVGPLIGAVFVWISPQWSRREKVIGTLFAGVPLLAVVVIFIGGAVLFASSAGDSTSVPIPSAPAASAIP